MPLNTPGLSGPAASNAVALAGDNSAAGEFAPRFDLWTSASITSGTGVLSMVFFTARATEAITTVTTVTGGTAAAATPTVCRIGVYSVDASDNCTLINSTANDTTLWAATLTAYPKALSSTFNKVAGQRYAVALICVSGAATPVFCGALLANNTPIATLALGPPAKAARILSLSDLPTPTIAVGSLAVSAQRPGFKLS